jgi:predicted TIM-barrel fold metal-dependent hydrolase
MRRRPLWFFDGAPISNDGNISQYNRIRGPLAFARADTNVMVAVERGYDAEAQVMGMEMEGIDIAVLFPTVGLSFLARDDMDPKFSAAICRAYNYWLHNFCQHSPDQLKMAAMLPIHDLNLACQELHGCVSDYGQSELLCGQTTSTVATGIPPTGTRCTVCSRT